MYDKSFLSAFGLPANTFQYPVWKSCIITFTHRLAESAFTINGSLPKRLAFPAEKALIPEETGVGNQGISPAVFNSIYNRITGYRLYADIGKILIKTKSH